MASLGGAGGEIMRPGGPVTSGGGTERVGHGKLVLTCALVEAAVEIRVAPERLAPPRRVKIYLPRLPFACHELLEPSHRTG